MNHSGSLVVVLLSVLSGCSLTQGGAADGGVTDTGPSDVAQDVPVIPDSGPDVVDAGETCKLGNDVVSVEKCPGERCALGECAYFTSCNDMHKARPTLPSGLHQFKSPLGFAFCDMEKEGGGWTLVGRSVASAIQPASGFGWLKAAGDPSQDTVPYSLDVTKYPGSPTEALVGLYTSGKTWGVPVYKITLPAVFPAGFGTSSALVTGSAIVQPSCGAALATNLTYVGYASNVTNFYFDPTGAAGALGLSWNGFLLGGVDDCASNGNMDSKQGQIFVR
jgi:hypothetical protein